MRAGEDDNLLSSLRASECLDSPINGSRNQNAYLVDVDLTFPAEADRPDIESFQSNLLDDNDPNDHPTSERKNKDDGWSAYQVISILGQGSYGKVYKVVKKEVQ